jgi:hypothetical protein
VAIESTRPIGSTLPALAHGPRVDWRAYVLVALDLTITLYLAALVVTVTTGGIDVGWLSIRQGAKPFLMLWLLVPIRLAAYGLVAPFAGASGRWASVWSVVTARANRLPPAIRDVGFAYLVTRATVVAVGFLVNLLYPPAMQRPFDLPFDSEKLAQTFAAWDSGWYFDIARHGYYHSPDGQSSVAFFPLYPLAMRLLAWPLGSSDAAIWAAGVVISNVAFFLALVVLHGLTWRLCGDRESARRTVLYLSVFPFSFFLSRVYPSGLFLLLTVAAVSAATKSRWWLSGVCGGLAALARPQGILIAIPLGLMALTGATRRDVAVRAVALAPIPLAFLAYNAYIGALAGDPLAWLASERQWGYSLGHPPWEQLLALVAKVERYGLYDYFATSNMAAYRLFHGVTALVFIAATPWVFTRLGKPLGLYVLVSLLVPLSGNALEGIGRYAAVLFPVFMVLGMSRAPRVHEGLLVVWSLFLALFVGLFVTWRPIY